MAMTRRKVLSCAAALVSAPVLSSIARLARADAPLVAADDPTAVAMHYVDDAAKSSQAKSGSRCATCALYQGSTDSTQGPCSIFPGKQVKATGWCMAWAAKT